MDRTISKQVTGFRTQDGAGVNLVRVLGHGTVESYDPILMLVLLTASTRMTIPRDSPCIPIGASKPSVMSIVDK